MPIYEYRCRDCGSTFERLERLNSTAKRACPQCRSDDTDRLVSAFASTSPSTGTRLAAGPSHAGCGSSGFS